MSQTILDGTGQGYRAGVTSTNRLKVDSGIKNEIREISETTFKAFIAYTSHDFTAGSGTNENIGYFTYTGNGSMHVDQIVFSTDSASAKVELFMDPTSVSGGDSYTPLNLNRSSSQTSETTVLSGTSDITATTTAANEFLDIRLNVGTFAFDMRGAFVMRKGDSFLIRGSVVTAADKIRATVYFFEEADS